MCCTNVQSDQTFSFKKHKRTSISVQCTHLSSLLFLITMHFGKKLQVVADLPALALSRNVHVYKGLSQWLSGSFKTLLTTMGVRASEQQVDLQMLFWQNNAHAADPAIKT